MSATPIDALYKSFAPKEYDGHFGGYGAPQIVLPNHEHFIKESDVPVNRNAVHDYMNGSMNNFTAPFARSSYAIDPRSDDRVYTGIHTDPVTGKQYHTFEEAMPERETDENLQPSNEGMDRLREMFSGGLNNDEAIRHMGIPDYKPEENNMEHQMTPEDTVRHNFGNWDILRQYADRRAQEESTRRMENNFEGINEKEGGPTGSLGIHHLGYTKDYNHVPISGYELGDKGRIANPTSQVELPGAWAQPTQITRQENYANWHSMGIGGHTFAMRDVNDMPGDREARMQPPQFLKPYVQVILS